MGKTAADIRFINGKWEQVTRGQMVKLVLVKSGEPIFGSEAASNSLIAVKVGNACDLSTFVRINCVCVNGMSSAIRFSCNFFEFTYIY